MNKAVITGDIVRSGGMNKAERDILIGSISDALKTWGRDFKMKSEMYRGDSFQCFLDRPADGLRSALLIKTFVRSMHSGEHDVKIAVGIGIAEAKDRTLASSHGEAFTLSGHLLDKLKNTKRSIAVVSMDSYRDELETESVLLDHIISRTTAQQCDVLNLKLLGYNETDIADRLGIKQSAVNQRSVSGGWNAIRTGVERFENIYSNE